MISRRIRNGHQAPRWPFALRQDSEIASKVRVYWPGIAGAENIVLINPGADVITPINDPGYIDQGDHIAITVTPTSTQYFQMLAGAAMRPAPPFSMSIWVKSDSTATTRAVMANDGGANPASDYNYSGAFFTYGFASGTNTTTIHAWAGDNAGAGAGNRKTRAASETRAAGTLVCVSGDFYGGSIAPDIYLDGEQKNGTASGTASSLTYRTPGYVNIGALGQGLASNWTTFFGSLSRAAIYGGLLTSAEHAELYVRPWGILEEYGRRTYFFPAAAPPGGFIAAWARGSNTVIQAVA